MTIKRQLWNCFAATALVLMANAQASATSLAPVISLLLDEECIVTNLNVASPLNITGLGNSVYFSGGSESDKTAWRSDGTPSGTFELTSFLEPNAMRSASNFTQSGSKVYFSAGSSGYSSYGEELFVYYYELGYATLVSDIQPGITGSSPDHLIAAGDIIYFDTFNTNGDFQRYLWSTDGSDTKQVSPSIKVSISSQVALWNDILFIADDISGYGVELTVIEQASSNSFDSMYFYDLVTGGLGSNPRSFIHHGGALYFVIDNDPSNPFPLNGSSIYKYDDSGLNKVSSVSGTIKDIIDGGDLIYFADELSNSLYAYDPVLDEVRLIYVFDSISSTTKYFNKADDGRLYFFAGDSSGWGLWVTNSKDGTTKFIKAQGADETFISWTTLAVGNKIYFRLITPLYGSELWVNSGTAQTTKLVADINEGAGDSDHPAFSEPFGKTSNREIYFSASDGENESLYKARCF